MTEQPRRRDAARTRQRLLDAARQRFARDGYAATSLREIADDADVNVALISRYFGSKEGLFGQCLTGAEEELRRAVGDVPLHRISDAITNQIVDTGPHREPHQVLLLLLRSPGDERANQIRLEVLRSYGERLATAAGWQPGEHDDGQLILRAQLLLAASAGIMLLRRSGLEPLASTGEDDLAGPLRDLVDALLSPR